MNTTDKALAGLLTGIEETDSLLRQAFELGIRHGQEAGRKSCQKSMQIETTRRLIATLMRTQHLDLETAMATLELPRKDRKIYRKIFSNNQKVN